MAMNIVLVEPEIPKTLETLQELQGNGQHLHIVKPMGFFAIDDKS